MPWPHLPGARRTIANSGDFWLPAEEDNPWRQRPFDYQGDETDKEPGELEKANEVQHELCSYVLPRHVGFFLLGLDSCAATGRTNTQAVTVEHPILATGVNSLFQKKKLLHVSNRRSRERSIGRQISCMPSYRPFR